MQKRRDVITDRQIAILGHLDAFLQDKGYAPSVRELCQLTGIKSPNGIACHFQALIRHGLIQMVPNLARTTSITPDGKLILQRRTA